MLLNQLNAASIPVFNAQVPEEGPKCVPLLFDFTGSTTEIDLDLTQLIDNRLISMIQTLFIDTTGAAGTLSIKINGSNQTITVKANTQGYYPVMVPNPAKFVATSTAGATKIFTIVFINVPVAPGQWATV